MQFISLNLRNWMIYKGEQSILFGDGKSNVTVIFGENMHGKTSLLNSIRWCLYGKAIDRQKSAIHPNSLINSVAFQQGERKFSVTLKLDIDGKVYDIWREIELSESGPINDLRLTIDGRAIDAGKIEYEIENILPYQISQFMLFDGELLKEFENLVVAQGNSQAAGIKNAIEETLGLPQLRYTTEEIENELKKLRQQSKQLLQKDEKSKRLAQRIADLDTLLEAKQTDKRILLDAIEKYTKDLDQLSEQLHENEEALKIIERRNAAKQKKDEALERQQALSDELKELSVDMWLVPLREAVAPLKSRYKANLEAVEAQKNSHYAKLAEQIKLRKTLDDALCPTCGADLADSRIQEVTDRYNSLEAELSQDINFEDAAFDLQTKLRGLNFAPNVHPEPQKFIAKFETNEALEKDAVQAETDIFRYNEKLKGVDEQTSLITRRKYDAVNSELGAHRNSLEICEQEIQKIDSDKRNLKSSREFEEVSSNSAVFAREKKAEDLKEIFESASALYRDRMRVDIEERATETFSHLTTEATFDKLEINDNYGLNLIVGGQKVNRSAGAEQIVAMSLIEALNHHGRRKGPMIMDTPVGRLDNKHRANILKHLPKVVTQLAIFAHSGELDEGSTLLDPNLVGKRYRIVRHSTFIAELKEV